MNLGGAVAAAGGSHDIAVGTQAGCAWAAVSTAPWITIAAGASASAPDIVAIDVLPNPSPTAAARR